MGVLAGLMEGGANSNSKKYLPGLLTFSTKGKYCVNRSLKS